MVSSAVLAGALVVGLTSLPGIALASTARLSFANFTYNAEPGEINRVSVVQSGLTVTVTDRVSISGRGTCVHPPNAPRRVNCAFRQAELSRLEYLIDLGDGNDSAFLSGSTSASLVVPTIEDGPGNDAVRLGRTGWFLNGPGDDVFRGSQGIDLSKEGAGLGNDTFYGYGGNDDFIGGAGNDRLIGGAGNDELRGRLANDVIHGGPGDDYVSGSAGNDTVVAGPGVDVILGGIGNDGINSADGVAETVNCEGGVDTVRADRSDRLLGCERITRL